MYISLFKQLRMNKMYGVLQGKEYLPSYLKQKKLTSFVKWKLYIDQFDSFSS